MHILIVPSWYSNPVNPVQGSFFRDQALALKKQGVKVGVIAPHQRSITTFREGHLSDYNYRILATELDNEIPVLKSYGWGLASLKHLNILIWYFQVQRLYKKYVDQFGKPDLIHVHSAIWGGLAIVRLSRKYKIPYVITEHFSKFVTGDIATWQEPYLHECFIGASKVIAVSSYLAKNIKSYSGNSEIKIIPNLVDVSFFTLPPRSRNSNDTYNILCVANLVPIKGIDILIRAFCKSFSGNANVCLEIAGAGEQRNFLENLVNELGCSKQITFLGLLNKKAVRTAMWRSNLFVLPSHAETFGVVLIEAMSTGLNVVSTRCGGADKLVTPEVGTLVETGNIDALASMLIKSKVDYVWSQEKEILIRNYIKKNFSESIVNKQLIEVYTSVINNFNADL